MDLRRRLQRWVDAGLIDEASSMRILEFERGRGRTLRLGWPVVLALSLGALSIGSGVLLFISANWDVLSPFGRMMLVLLLVAGFHVAGAVVVHRFEALAVTFHALGTISLGAGIALTGQIFNLAENWPAATMLWSAGAVCGLLLLRDWPQMTLVSILIPWWLSAEWVSRHPGHIPAVVLAFLLLLALSYLTAVLPGKSTDHRRALAVLGSIVVLPLGVMAAGIPLAERRQPLPDGGAWAAWGVALLLPLGLAAALRGANAWLNGVAAAWVVLLSLAAQQHWSLFVHFWGAMGAVGLIGWGLLEARTERVNLGVAGFAVSVLFFYFSNVMDKLGRSTSLIFLGLLFLGGGWMLEKARRRLIAQVRGGPA